MLGACAPPPGAGDDDASLASTTEPGVTTGASTGADLDPAEPGTTNTGEPVSGTSSGAGDSTSGGEAASSSGSTGDSGGSTGTSSDGGSSSSGDLPGSSCTTHDECPVSACHLDGPDQGTCFELAQVTDFGGSGLELEALLEGLPVNDQRVVRLLPGTQITLMRSVDLPLGVELALIGSPGTFVALGAERSDAARIRGDSTILYLDELELPYGPQEGGFTSASLHLSNGSLWIEDTSIAHTGTAIRVDGGRGLHLLRSTIRNFDGPIPQVYLLGVDEIVIDRSIIHGGDSPLLCWADVLRIVASAIESGYTIGVSCTADDLLISYSTITGPTNEMMCVGDGIIRNSIIASATPPGNAPTCNGNTLEHNALDDGGPGGTNVMIGPYSPAWFVGPALGDYHLDPLQVGIPEIAAWQPGDPLVDVDGDPIPQVGPSRPGFDQP